MIFTITIHFTSSHTEDYIKKYLDERVSDIPEYDLWKVPVINECCCAPKERSYFLTAKYDTENFDHNVILALRNAIKVLENCKTFDNFDKKLYNYIKEFTDNKKTNKDRRIYKVSTCVECLNNWTPEKITQVVLSYFENYGCNVEVNVRDKLALHYPTNNVYHIDITFAVFSEFKAFDVDKFDNFLDENIVSNDLGNSQYEIKESKDGYSVLFKTRSITEFTEVKTLCDKLVNRTDKASF